MAEIVANAAVAAVVPALMQHELDVAEHPVQDPPFAPQRMTGRVRLRSGSWRILKVQVTTNCCVLWRSQTLSM